MRHMEAVSKEIISFRFKSSMTFREAMNGFYSIMRKYGIKRGTKIKGGAVIRNNPEWSMCWILFLSQLESFVNFEELMQDGPNDLKHY